MNKKMGIWLDNGWMDNEMHGWMDGLTSGWING